MTNACQSVRGRLPAYAADELSTAEARSVEDHLRDCAACALEAGEHRAARRLLRDAADLPVPIGLESRILRSLERLSAPVHVRARGSRWRGFAAAAALLIATVLGFWIGRHTSPPRVAEDREPPERTAPDSERDEEIAAAAREAATADSAARIAELSSRVASLERDLARLEDEQDAARRTEADLRAELARGTAREDALRDAHDGAAARVRQLAAETAALARRAEAAETERDREVERARTAIDELAARHASTESTMAARGSPTPDAGRTPNPRASRGVRITRRGDRRVLVTEGAPEDTVDQLFAMARNSDDDEVRRLALGALEGLVTEPEPPTRYAPRGREESEPTSLLADWRAGWTEIAGDLHVGATRDETSGARAREPTFTERLEELERIWLAASLSRALSSSEVDSHGTNR